MNTNGTMTRQPAQTAVSALDKQPIPREAWRMLAADQSNARDIAPDRWRLLAVAFANVPDDVLNRAVLAHIAASHHFPRVSDIKRQIDLICPPTSFDLLRQQMARAGYVFINDDGQTALFQGNGITAVVKH